MAFQVFELCIKGVSPCFELSYNLLVDRWRQAKEQRKMDLKNIRGGGVLYLISLLLNFKSIKEIELILPWFFLF